MLIAATDMHPRMVDEALDAGGALSIFVGRSTCVLGVTVANLVALSRDPGPCWGPQICTFDVSTSDAGFTVHATFTPETS